ncbi:MAG: M23 family metallopeptidase [Oscillospiraceae bacterium]|nr:M23 family metallopeptidase [Oscillospiraceae bacterium]
MTKHKKLLTALLISAIIISSSGCENSPEIPVINSEAEFSSSESSSSVSESLPEITVVPEVSSEPEEEPEPVLEPVVTLSSPEVERGSYFIIKAENIDLSETVFKDFLGYDRRFFENEGAWYCFVPVKTAAEAGTYNLEFSEGDFSYSAEITVLDKVFNTQYLVVEQATLDATLEDQAVREAFDVFYQKYRWYFSDIPLWNGGFVKPLGNYPYKETTKFGTFRTFSNGKTEWHNATDMAAPGGTPVYAANSGNIIFADWLGLTGNTILIDHGCGVLSWHYHLNSMNVSEGDFVEKNSLIGKVGTTGLSTGNHLHFGISVGGIFVDPIAMMGSEPNFDFGKVIEE